MNRTISLGDFETFAHVEPDKAQALKVLEEASEVCREWQNIQECASTYTQAVSSNVYYDDVFDLIKRTGIGFRARLINECSDVCQAVANLLQSFEVTDEEWQHAVKLCHGRNESRGRY